MKQYSAEVDVVCDVLLCPDLYIAICVDVSKAPPVL